MQQLMNSTLSISKVVPADENNVDGSVGADTCLFWVLIYLRCVAPPLNFGLAKFVVDEALMPSLVPGRGSNIERLRRLGRVSLLPPCHGRPSSREPTHTVIHSSVLQYLGALSLSLLMVRGAAT